MQRAPKACFDGFSIRLSVVIGESPRHVAFSKDGNTLTVTSDRVDGQREVLNQITQDFFSGAKSQRGEGLARRQDGSRGAARAVRTSKV